MTKQINDYTVDELSAKINAIKAEREKTANALKRYEEELHGRIEELESENKRLREALESIKEMSSYLSAGEITIYDLLDIHNICCDALKGGKE